MNLCFYCREQSGDVLLAQAAAGYGDHVMAMPLGFGRTDSGVEVGGLVADGKVNPKP